MTNELRNLYKEANTLPAGKRNKVQNLINKISCTIKSCNNEQTQQQIIDRDNAKQAILEAMKKGRRISFLDSAEFEVCEMHTQIHTIRKDIEQKNLPYTLCDEWIEFGKHGKKCKRYWLEKKEDKV